MNLDNNIKKLQEIEKNLASSNCLNLKEISEFYLRAKENSFINERVNSLEVSIVKGILLNCYIKTREYLLEKEIDELTDEELEIILIFYNEFFINASLFNDYEIGPIKEQLDQLKTVVLEERIKRGLKKGRNDNYTSKDESNNQISDDVKSSREKDLERELIFLNNQRKEKLLKERENNNPENNNPENNNPENNNPESKILSIFGIGIILFSLLFTIFRFKKFKKTK